MTDATTDAATSHGGHGRRWDRLLANAPRRGGRAFDTCEPAEVRAISAPANVTSIPAVTAVVATVAVLSVAPSAAAHDTPARLNDVARVYSLEVGDVRCPSQAEWDADPHRTSFGWGYTNLRRDYSVLPPMICAGALNVGSSSVPAWQQAAGVWMLVHEAFHLGQWRFRRNEAKVGCQTIVYFTDAAARLGASEAQAQLLYPYALGLYELEIDLYPWHRDPTCIVPPWIPPSAP
jgi:hypothetical protein